jgi:hypothetical protein
MLRNSNRTRLSPLVEICQLAEVLEHAIAKVLQAADDHGRSRHRIHFRSLKRAVLSADYWDSVRRGHSARTIAAVFRSHGEQSAGVATRSETAAASAEATCSYPLIHERESDTSTRASEDSFGN